MYTVYWYVWMNESCIDDEIKVKEGWKESKKRYIRKGERGGNKQQQILKEEV